MPRLLEAATRLGLTWDEEEVARLTEGGFMRLIPEGVTEQIATPIDLVLADSKFLDGALDRAVSAEVYGIKTRFVALEDLFLLKLIAFRPQDTLDLDTLWGGCRQDMDMGYLTHWAEVLGVDRKLSVFTDEE